MTQPESKHNHNEYQQWSQQLMESKIDEMKDIVMQVLARPHSFDNSKRETLIKQFVQMQSQIQCVWNKYSDLKQKIKDQSKTIHKQNDDLWKAVTLLKEYQWQMDNKCGLFDTTDWKSVAEEYRDANVDLHRTIGNLEIDIDWLKYYGMYFLLC